MFRFLKKFRQKMWAEGSLDKYLPYAVSEIMASLLIETRHHCAVILRETYAK